MNQNLLSKSMRKELEYFFEEDDISRNMFYIASLPEDTVKCSLKIKDDLLLAGLPYFFETFKYLGADNLNYKEFLKYEGQSFTKEQKFEIHFELPFSLALMGERIALNLLQRASSVATHTKYFVDNTKGMKTPVKILDTRKTTPGLRGLEKYAVVVGGGHNHRLGQTDVWMVKDNHKSFFGGVKEAIAYFESMKGFYTPLVLEVHNQEDLNEAILLGVKHVMLDNFTPDNILKAIAIKPKGMTYEASGGINETNIKDYMIEGIDAISMGGLTYNARAVDVSLKYSK